MRTHWDPPSGLGLQEWLWCQRIYDFNSCIAFHSHILVMLRKKDEMSLPEFYHAIYPQENRDAKKKLENDSEFASTGPVIITRFLSVCPPTHCIDLLLHIQGYRPSTLPHENNILTPAGSKTTHITLLNFLRNFACDNKCSYICGMAWDIIVSGSGMIVPLFITRTRKVCSIVWLFAWPIKSIFMTPKIYRATLGNHCCA